MSSAPDDRIQGYAEALFRIAEAEGRIDEVSDELFRFARTFEASEELRRALVDAALPLDRRLAVIDDLVGAKALTATTAIVVLIVSAGRIAELPAIVDRFGELVARAREQAVAEVRSAVPLDPDVVARLTEVLSSATGKAVEVKVVVDEKVLGGIVARIGDTVIDGSVRNRLEQLREKI